MRNFTTLAAITAVTLGALVCDIPAATAAPAPGIHWTAKTVGKSVVVHTDQGTLSTRDGRFQVLDPTGALAATLPLVYGINGQQFPIAVTIDGNTATLTPSTDATLAEPITMLQPIDQQADFDSALAAAGTQFGLATGVGALIGTLIGGIGGCVLGAIVPAALMTPIFVPGWVGGCLAGAAAGAALGAAAGTVLIGVPVGIVSAIQFFQRLNVPAAPAAAQVSPAEVAAM